MKFFILEYPEVGNQNKKEISVHPEMVDFGSERGLSVFEAAGIVHYFEDFKKAKTKLRAERRRFWMDT